MTPATLRAALGNLDDDFPRKALVWARDNAAQATPTLLAMLAACAKPGDLADRESVGGFYAGVLLAGMRETRAFPIICALARNGDRLDELFQDFGSEYLHRLLVGIDGGDARALFAIARDMHADPIIRASFLQAWTWHAVQGDRAAEFEEATELRETFVGEDHALLWHEWALALIALDAAKAAPLIVEVCGRGSIDRSFAEEGDYLAEAAAWREDPDGRRSTYFIENGPIADPVATLERWIATLERAHEAGDEDERGGDDAVAGDSDRPADNPLRHVGRNEPCPCGSGKKFKKCCLALQANEAL